VENQVNEEKACRGQSLLKKKAKLVDRTREMAGRERDSVKKF